MTIQEAIDQVNDLKPNYYNDEHKVRWLSRLDKQIRREIIDTHEDAPEEEFTGYDTETDTDTVLLVPEPYDEVYIHWLAAQIDLNNAEYEKFNNSNALFAAAYNAYASAYNRAHMPKSTKVRYY